MGNVKKFDAQPFLLKIAGERYRDFALALLHWKACVGKGMNACSRVEKYENGILYISVVDNIWLQEFFLLKEQIMDRLHKRTGLVLRDIIFYLKNNKEVYKWLKTKNHS